MTSGLDSTQSTHYYQRLHFDTIISICQVENISKLAASRTQVPHLFNMRPFLASFLLGVLALVSATPESQLKKAKEDDDFWARKPMHTTDLMAGKAHTKNQVSTSQTQIPTATTGIPMTSVDNYEL